MERLARRLTELFADDPSKPSVAVSWLGDRWYASAVRYLGEYGEGRVVLMAVSGDSLQDLLQQLSENFDV